MTSCPSSARPPFTCPTLEQSIQATAALLPRGKAWPANDGGGTIANFLAWLASLGNRIPAPGDWPAGYVQAGFVAALGTVRNWIEGQFCALKDEFFCASATTTLDLWNAEYGLPDNCDPYPNLCAKVGYFGSPHCPSWVALAASLGWSIACSDFGGGTQAGCCHAGNALANPGAQATIVTITVFLDSSGAYGIPMSTPSRAGIFLAGQQQQCQPNITSLECAFQRILPAHLTVNYVTDNSSAFVALVARGTAAASGRARISI